MKHFTSIPTSTMGFDDTDTDSFTPQKEKDGPPWILISLFAMSCIGAGIFFTFRAGVFDPKGMPIPNLSGEIAFRVPTQSLTANAIYENDDGNTIHYINQPTRITPAMAGDNQHIVVQVDASFGLTTPVAAYRVLFGRELFDDCTNDTVHLKDVWFYKYSSPQYELEKTGTFPIENFYIAHCSDLLTQYESNYPNGDETTPIISQGDLLYVAPHPAGITAVESAVVAGGAAGELFAVIGYDADNDGLVEQAGNIGEENSFDTDADGLSDGEEITGSIAFHANVLNWNEEDTDGDGIKDGIELGRPENTETGFVGDADPTTVTDPANPDTDGGGICDGPNTVTDESGTEICTSGEDMNANGKADEGETDPTEGNETDDIVVPPAVCDPVCDADQKCVDDAGTPTCITACGDGVVDVALGEECDDENDVDTDTCTNQCLLGFCGDGIRQPAGADGIEGDDAATTDVDESADDEECDEGTRCADNTLCVEASECANVTEDQECKTRTPACDDTCKIIPLVDIDNL